MKLSKVIINSVTVKDDDGSPDPNLVIGWEYEKSDTDEISEVEILISKSVDDTVTISNGQVIEVWGGNTTSTDKRYFYGFVDKITPQGATIKVIGKNELGTLVRKNVNHVYDSGIDASAGEISEIAEDLIETYGGMNGTVQSSGTEDGRRIDVFKCINTDIYERLMALKKALDWQIRYDDENRVVHFEPRGYTDSKKTLTVGTEIVGMPAWDYDTTNMINDLRVNGATIQTDLTESGRIGTTSGYTTTSILLTKTPDIVELYIDAADPPTTQRTGGTKDASTGHFYYVDRENKKVMPAAGTTFTTDHYAIINYTWSAQAPIHTANQKSIDDYGSFEKEIELFDVSSVADAESRAQSILSLRSLPFISANMLVKSTDMPNVGELVNIIDTRSPKGPGGISPSGQYIVNKITYKWPSPIEEMEIGDKGWRLVDWQQNTEDRLKRLEEQFIRNQDLLMELVNIQHVADDNFLKPAARYRQVITQDIRSAGGEYSFVLGHASGGVLGTNLLGDRRQAEVTVFMMQAENSYTEDFIDDDFENASTTADWDTTNEYLDFTADEVAHSETIDYNNGTITTAKLTSTESSGNFDYYLSADGGSNWEAVTSGTAHTFTNTGTSLRWRADEADSSTGRITQIKVEDYH
ncbi:hypothetical protein KA005_68720 [bacterium]|nr:hypothetical protein [bacterium]